MLIWILMNTFNSQKIFAIKFNLCENTTLLHAPTHTHDHLIYSNQAEESFWNNLTRAIHLHATSDSLLLEWVGCWLADAGGVLFEVGSCRERVDNGAAVAHWHHTHQLSTLIFPNPRHLRGVVCTEWIWVLTLSKRKRVHAYTLCLHMYYFISVTGCYLQLLSLRIYM